MTDRQGPDLAVQARFWSRVSRSGDGCWLWNGYVRPNGYGAFTFGSWRRGVNRTLYAHRLSYELLIGPIPPGLELDHLCRTRRCVRPDDVRGRVHRDCWICKRERQHRRNMRRHMQKATS